MSELWTPPTYRDIRTAVFETHKFHCEDCGCELLFSHPSFYYLINDCRVMLQGPHTHNLCGPCLGKRIAKWFATPMVRLKPESTYNRRHKRTCQICGKTKKTATIIWDEWCNCRFGSISWNGHWICKDCLVETATFGRADSGWTESYQGVSYYVNEHGARVKYPK